VVSFSEFEQRVMQELQQLGTPKEMILVTGARSDHVCARFGKPMHWSMRPLDHGTEPILECGGSTPLWLPAA
jgi:hypothetical protein